VYPQDFKYHKEHTWLKIEDKTKGRIGITDFAQKELHEVVFVELPSVGTQITQSEPFGSIESRKTAHDLYSPISGMVLEVNQELEIQPNLVNKDPHGNGWMIIVEIKNAAETETLLSAEQYAALVKA
jgi:glycine cleavage system H protein